MNNLDRTAAQLDQWEIPYQTNQPLAACTTFQIGGPAALFCRPEDPRQLAGAVAAARQNGLPFFVLGAGSNVLFRDEGYPGLVVHVGPAFGQIAAEGDTLCAGAGVRLMDLCEAALRHDLAGLEFAYGIPGSVGGAIFMNAGAFGGEICDVVCEIQFIDETGALRAMGPEQAGFYYRSSVFQANPWPILGAAFQLKPGIHGAIEEQMQGHWAHRREKQPLEYPSAGSAFKRPEGAYASALIDQCGLRGYRVGGAAVSEKHCGFIVNLGGATCRDVLQLADEVVRQVQAQTGFVLEKEIRVVDAARPGE